MESGNRKVCPFCEQELAHTAFTRHLSDNTGRICPARSRFSRSPSPRAADLDSTFDLGSSDLEAPSEILSDNSYTSCDDAGNLSDSEMSIASSTDSDSSSDSVTLSSEDEVWDDMESEEQKEVDNSVGVVVLGISYFLTFYHLVYHLSQRAITSLLGFIRLLLYYLAITTGQDRLLQIVNALPKSMLTIQTAFKQDNFIEYVVCPKCCKLYLLSDCIIDNHGQVTSKLCDYIEFPDHPFSSQRKACSEILLKRIKVGKKIKLVPRKVYVYRSIIQSLKAMMGRKNFLEKCDLWRSRPKNNAQNFMADIYDGKLWQDMTTIDGRPFLALPNNLCLSLNVDWFRVYKHSPYSAGPIYLVILNLPRHERYKEENIILAGIIPGPKEPKEHINTFLSPLVQDLQRLYEGVTFKNPSSLLNITITIRATLGCIVCDLPATRKVCGFANFNGNCGCSKCMKNFVTTAFGYKPSYAGFDCDNWTPRNIDTHISIATNYLTASTKSARKKIIHDSGIRYSELLNIPHFDIVRCHVVDPMHNIFLGLAKHLIHTWKEKDILLPQHFSQLQEKVDLMTPPPKVGRIPRKIECKFSSFTADEWKNWILIFSSFAFHDIIDEPHYSCWSLLVATCTLLCRPLLSPDHVNQAHILLVEFCELFETLYGVESCVPNMHMSLHLKQCLLDFGPLPAFWCFAFERFNGALEGISKSWISPERQMFLKFSGLQALKYFSDDLPADNFLAMISDHVIVKAKDDYGSLGLTVSQDALMIHDFQNVSCKVSLIDAVRKSHQHLVSPFKEKYFTDPELICLQEMYIFLYPSRKFEVARFYKEHKKVIINNVEYVSSRCRSQRSAVVAAKWPGVIGIDKHGEAPLRIGLVTSFIDHEIILPESNCSPAASHQSHILACIQWYGDHPRRDYLQSPIVLTPTVFDSPSCASFMPVSRIMCQCAISSPVSLTFDYGVDNVLVAVPLSIEL